MTAIEATSSGVRDLADGSLRITFEFDPRFASQAFTLFGSRGTSVAVAALKTVQQQDQTDAANNEPLPSLYDSSFVENI